MTVSFHSNPMMSARPCSRQGTIECNDTGGFGMRRTDRELRDPAEIRDVLGKADACHLALADNDTPYLVTLNFGLRQGGRLVLYFHCADEGRKIDMLRRNNRVCFGADVDREFFQADTGTSCGCSMRYRSVVGSGRVTFITDPVEKLEGLTAILEHFTPGTAPRFTDEMVARTTVLRLDVEEISGKRRA